MNHWTQLTLTRRAYRSRRTSLALRSLAVQSRGMWWQMRSLLSRLSDWVVVHPVLWGVGLAVVLVLLGFALKLAPILVIAAGAAIAVLNILHARRRGYCPLPAEPGSHPGRAEAE